MILIEAKDDPLLGGRNPKIEPIPFGADEFDAPGYRDPLRVSRGAAIHSR